MSTPFHLEVAGSGVATLTFDHPGSDVNLLSRPNLDAFEREIEGLTRRDDIGALVLLSAKPTTFCAGFQVEDIAAVEDPTQAEAVSRRGQALFAAWESLPFPTIAAIRGTCLGGGTELALASTWIVASDRPGVRIGLPEVRLGILPAWGGCVRLPQRVGIAAALDIILQGKAVSSRSALRLGLADALVPDADFLARVRDFAFARRGIGESAASPRPDLMELLLERNPVGRRVLFSQARAKTLEATGGHYPAPLRALEVVRIGVERGAAAGFDAEARAAAELATSPVCKSLMHVFFLMEGAKKGVGTGESPAIDEIAVLGAGVMGGGIAQLAANQADLPVRLKDVQLPALATGLSHARRLLARQVEKRRLRESEAQRKLALIRPCLDYRGFGRCGLLIEAVVEKLEVKQAVLAEAARHLPPDAVLASNTSSLPIDQIGARVPQPERVVGMHFFNPVDRMPLVEVVVGKRTSPASTAAAAAFARRLGKTPIVVRDAPGFLVNRLLGFYMVEALWLLAEGQRIEVIDRAMTGWGMPMGPLALIDEVGIDVAVEVARILAAAFGERLPLPPWAEVLPDPERLGKKTGAGMYLWEESRRGAPNPAVYELLGAEPTAAPLATAVIADRLVLPMVDEAARCLQEGIVAGAGELDLAMILGTGFPPFRGGLCRWADRQGVSFLVEELERLTSRTDERFSPSDALRQIAAEGGFNARYPGRASDPSS